MIGVIMRPENGIDLVDMVSQKLAPQIGRGIDQYSLAGIVLDDDRNTATPVPRFA
jgi:hypothetical protein